MDKPYCDDHPSKNEPLPFTIGFDEKGIPFIADKAGNRIRGKEVSFPVKDVKAITMITNISIVGVIGSHYCIADINGRYERFDLPAPHPDPS